MGSSHASAELEKHRDTVMIALDRAVSERPSSLTSYHVLANAKQPYSSPPQLVRTFDSSYMQAKLPRRAPIQSRGKPSKCNELFFGLAMEWVASQQDADIPAFMSNESFLCMLLVSR